jgi:hypothetical protein
MKHRLLFFVLIVLFTCSAKAQKTNFSIGPEINIPSGNSSNISSIGVGGYLKGEFPVANKFSLTASATLNTFYGKKVLQYQAPNLSYLPVKAGLKYYPADEFYLEGQAGASFAIKNDYNTNFIWSLGLGTFLKAGENNKIDIGLRYESQKNSAQYYLQTNKSNASFGYIGLRVGYVF